MSNDLYIRYLGVLGILADCSVHLRESGESQDLRERIESAMDELALVTRSHGVESSTESRSGRNRETRVKLFLSPEVRS